MILGYIPKNFRYLVILIVVTLKTLDAYKLENNQTLEREFGNLLSIDDQYPKYVVTMDEFWKDSIEGVVHMYITDFLLKKNWWKLVATPFISMTLKWWVGKKMNETKSEAFYIFTNK